MNNVKTPKYDNDLVSFGYLKRLLDQQNQKQDKQLEFLTHNYSSPPVPPYSANSTLTYENKLYRCKSSRKIGSFSWDDWELVLDGNALDNFITQNFLSLKEITYSAQSDGKIETFYQDTDPSNEWLTSLEKEKHLNDYWRVQKDDAYENYVYTKINLSPLQYDWKKIDVPFVVFDVGTGHKSIYLKKPESYLKNDLWRLSKEDLSLFSGFQEGDYVYAKQSSSIFAIDDWEKQNDSISLKYFDTYFYSIQEIDKRTEIINQKIAADILKSEGAIKLYASQTYTERTTTTVLEKTISEQGEKVTELEQVVEETTDHIASLDVQADSLAAVVATKVGANQIATSLNMTPQSAKIKSSLLAIEGYTSINEGFAIDEEGTAHMKNGVVEGGILKLVDGAELVSEKGLLTNLQFVGTGRKNSQKSITGEFNELGFSPNDGSDLTTNLRNELIFNAEIPADFIVEKATIRLHHAPVNYGYEDDSGVHYFWGYSRKLKLYKTTDISDYYRKSFLFSSSEETENFSYEEISGAFGANGFTASIPSDSSHTVQEVVSTDISSSLISGKLNRIRIASADDPPSYDGNEWYGNAKACAEKTGICMAVLNVIGYKKFEEGV